MRKRAGIKSVLDLASAKLSLEQEWDSNPYLLAVKNGIIELKTGELRTGQPQDYIRNCSKTEWKGLEEPAPRFEQFLQEIFNNDQSLIDFIQRLLGYSLTGLSVEHVFPVFYGAEGRNGKDTLLKLICKILGDNLAGPVSKEVLLSGMKNPGASAPFLFELHNKRLVYADETSEGAVFDEGQIKMLSGGAPFQAKKLYQQPTTIHPQYLMIMTTNNKPKIDADDPAIWERILLVPFEQRFIESPQYDNEHPVDKFLDEKLEAEMSGVLAWLVRGCLEWQKRKSFDAPESVRYATDSYRDENDSIGKFIKDELLLDDEQRTQVTKLYDHYCDYCAGNAFPKLGKREFTKKLDAQGIERRRFSEGYCYIGITRKPTLDEEIEVWLEQAQTASK